MKPWQKTYDLAGYRCVYCKEPLWEDLRLWHNATIDHLYPRSKKFAGSDSASNRVAACQLCNSLKGHFIPAMASNHGVIVKRAISGKKEVHANYRTDYIAAVWAEIRKRKDIRRKQFYVERRRLQALRRSSRQLAPSVR
jgi:hypothetical protein